MYAALLFDIDETLVSTTDHWIAAYRETLADYGIELTRQQFLERVYHAFAPHLSVVLERLSVPVAEAEFRERRDQRYCDRLRAASSLWLPDAEDTLRRAAARVPVGLMTASWRRYVEAIDDNTGLLALAPTCVCHDEIERGKPDPQGLLLVARRLGVDPGRCVYLGDQPHDIDAATNAGMDSCWVKGRYTKARPTTPTHTCHSITAAVAWALSASP